MSHEITPNLFVVGVVKAGTTSMYHILNEHPQVQMASVKEPHYFSTVHIKSSSTHAASISEEPEYRSLFQNDVQTKYYGEASPSYFWDPTSAEKIHNFNPESKIIILLREPLDRAFSHYNMEFSARREKNQEFYSALKEDWNLNNKGWGISALYIELGFYFEGIQRFQKVFGKDNVLILFFEEFFKNKDYHREKIWSWLGLENHVIQVPEDNRNQSLQFNRFTRKLYQLIPGYWLPDWIKKPLKNQLFANGSKLDSKSIQFLLKLYEEDLIRQRDELKMDYYFNLVKKRYGIDETRI